MKNLIQRPKTSNGAFNVGYRAGISRKSSSGTRHRPTADGRTRVAPVAAENRKHTGQAVVRSWLGLTMYHMRQNN